MVRGMTPAASAIFAIIPLPKWTGFVPVSRVNSFIPGRRWKAEKPAPFLDRLL